MLNRNKHFSQSKRKDDRNQQRETDSQMKYADYRLEEMFITGTLKKLKVSGLNLFLENQLGNKKMKKNQKLVLISAWLAKAKLDKVTSVQPVRKVNLEKNVDSYDGDKEEEAGDDDNGVYDSDNADDDDDDDDDGTNGSDEKEYDGSSKD